MFRQSADLDNLKIEDLLDEEELGQLKEMGVEDHGLVESFDMSVSSQGVL